MKGTLSLTRIRPQTYSIRGAAGQPSRFRVSTRRVLSIVSAILPELHVLFSSHAPFVTPVISRLAKVTLAHPLTARTALLAFAPWQKRISPFSG